MPVAQRVSNRLSTRPDEALTIAHMKMRRGVIIIEHGDDNTEEPTEFRHFLPLRAVRSHRRIRLSCWEITPPPENRRVSLVRRKTNNRRRCHVFFSPGIRKRLLFFSAQNWGTANKSIVIPDPITDTYFNSNIILQDVTPICLRLTPFVGTREFDAKRTSYERKLL